MTDAPAPPPRTRELWLVVEAQGARHEVVAELRGAPRVSELAAALAEHLGVEGDAALELARDRTPQPLAPDAPVHTTPLRSGSAVRLVRDGAGRARRAPSVAGDRVDLVVAGGAAAGTVVRLRRGTYAVGRDGACEVVLPDPALSRTHLLVKVTGGGEVLVADAGSQNGTALEGVRLDGPARWEPGRLVRAGRTLLRVQPSALADEAPEPGDDEVNRPPRVRSAPPVAPVRVVAPPTPPTPARLPILAALLPLVGGVGLALLLGQTALLALAVLSPLVAVGTWAEDRRRARRQAARDRAAFEEELRAAEGALADAAQRRAQALRDEAPDPAELAGRTRRRERVWERGPEDDDALALRVGSADREPEAGAYVVEAGGDRAARAAAEERLARAAVLHEVPVCAPVGQAGSLGVAGTDGPLDGVVRWLVAQAAALHSPRDLRIAAALGPARGADWLTWLPHVRRERSPLDHRHVVDTADAARGLVRALEALVAQRRADAAANRDGPRPAPAVLAVLDTALVPAGALRTLLREGPEAAVHIVALAPDRDALPADLGAVAVLDDRLARLSLVDLRARTPPVDATLDAMSEETARAVARALAPLRDASDAAGAGRIPPALGLLEALGADEPLAGWIEGRWTAAGAARGAVLGAAAGERFTIDLRADGPHGLVGGTTGAGKSELLQTLVAALASALPPERLTFLLVDYKGGSAFKDCIALPHVVGLVTDLDEHLAARALVSLNAEIRRRERVLASFDARDLVELERRAPDQAPPSLVLVVDEFAALVREVPDFVDGVVDVAQRGRSLGVHMLLATQRPAGVINDNIRANVDLRIALRMSSPAESTDVIGVPDAARISRRLPGRAIARIGSSAPVELQVAYAGARPRARTDGHGIRIRALAGGTAMPRRDGDTAVGEEAPSDLERVVAAAGAVFGRHGRPRPHAPWLPPLPATLDLAAADPEPEAGRPVAVLGLVDEPERQAQRPATLDLGREGGLLVFGMSGSGKSTLLWTIALSLARRLGPDRLHLYGLDFGGGRLGPLAALPHCGAVVGEDEERVRRLLRLLRERIDERRRLLAEHAVAALADLPEDVAPPRIVVLLDGYAAFAAAYDKVGLADLVEAVPRIVTDGQPVGVHVVVALERRTGVPAAITGAIANVVVLRMASEDEYGLVGIEPRRVRGRELPPGRGFLRGTELQCALPGADASADAFRAAVADVVARTPAAAPPRAPAPVASLPREVPREAVGAARGLWTPLGLGDERLAPVGLDLSEDHALVCGPYRSGRSTALATLAAGLRAADAGLELHLLAPRRSHLPRLEVWTAVAEGDEACAAAVAGLLARGPAEGAGPVVVIIDDEELLEETLVARDLEQLVRRGRDGGVRIVAAAENQAALRAYGGALRELRKAEQGVLLQPNLDLDGDVLGVRLPRRTSSPSSPGRGFLVARGRVELVQVAR